MATAILKKLCFAAGLMIVSSTAIADLVKRSMPACITEESLDELTTYSVKGDQDGIKQLFVSGHCVMLNAGQIVSVIRPGFTVATVRLNGRKLFTPSEALR